MWFLIKGSFWFTLVLLLLPIFDAEGNPDGASMGDIEFAETIGAAQAAIADIGALCERRPDVCETGGQTIAALGGRAREGARVAFEMLDSRFGDNTVKSDTPDPVLTGTVEPAQTPTAD